MTRCGTESWRWRLRSAGTDVALSQLLDAAEALRHIRLADREELRTALRTLVKHAHELARFDALFDVCFPARPPAPGDPAPPAAATAGDARPRRPAAGRAGAGLVDAGTEAELRLLAEEAVAHHAGFEQGAQRALPRLPGAAGGRARPPAARRLRRARGAGRRAVPCRRVRPGGDPAPAHHRGGARPAGGGGRSRLLAPSPARSMSSWPGPLRPSWRRCAAVGPWPAGWRPACGAAARACGRERWT